MRIRSKWSAKHRDRSPEEIAGVVAFIAWRICTQAVLELENNDFQTDTQVQRLAIIWEFAAFLIHITDRMMYERMDEEERAGVHLCDGESNGTDHAGQYGRLSRQRRI